MINFDNDWEILADIKFRQEFVKCWHKDKRSGSVPVLPTVSDLYHRCKIKVEKYAQRFQTVPSDEMICFIIERELNAQS